MTMQTQHDFPPDQHDILQQPPTKKQLIFARQIAQRTASLLPWDVQQEQHALSRWIDQHKTDRAPAFENRTATSRQVGFAERLARRHRTNVPDECYKSAELMSRWINARTK